MSTYRTLDGDMLDAIAHRELGAAAQVVDILAINPHLSAQPPQLPGGLLIVLPAPRAPQTSGRIRLWGRTP